MSDEVKELSLVICLPFNIWQGDARNESLGSVCTFLDKAISSQTWHPVSTLTEDAPDFLWKQLQAYQAWVYFNPSVRRFLFDPTKVCRYQRDDIQYMHVTFDDFTSKLKVMRCELVLFQPSIGILLLQLESCQELTLEQTQKLLDSVRRIYPPYFDNDDWKKEVTVLTWRGGHFPARVELRNGDNDIVGEVDEFTSQHKDSKAITFAKRYLDPVMQQCTSDQPLAYPWAAHWRTLLAPFNLDYPAVPDANSFYAEQLGDDRAPIMSWIAVDDPHAISRGDWMRLCFADAPGADRLPYAERFMSKFEQDFCYDRYWYRKADAADANLESFDFPSRILNCGYAFSYVGSAKDQYFFMNPKNGTRPTFDNIYVEIGLIAHFQKSALLSFLDQLTGMVNRGEGRGIKDCAIEIRSPEEVRRFYEHFIEFTKVFWFDEISSQIQGREIFDHWRQHLGIQKLYDEVRQELKDLVSYVELLNNAEVNEANAELNRTNEKLNRTNQDLNRIVAGFAVLSLVIGFLAVIAGILGMNNIHFDMVNLNNWWYFLVLAVPVLILLLGILFLLALQRLPRKWFKWFERAIAKALTNNLETQP